MMASRQIEAGLIACQGSTVLSGSTGSSRNVIARRIRTARISTQVMRRSAPCSGSLRASSSTVATAPAAATFTSPSTA